ncbi:alpha/beta hydrolase [Micrococcoides hystricis]|uniref:Alpha/beta hydrolase n=1 Tax=Micrococcoides hystricis TaxID=1572761 RepID=A0ABV6P6Q0_9MICC
MCGHHSYAVVFLPDWIAAASISSYISTVTSGKGHRVINHAEHAPINVVGKTNTALILIHGFTSGPASMREFAAELAAAGHHVHVPLLPGHATTIADLASTPYTAWQHAIKAAISAVAPSVESIWLVGQSMGGTLALDAACELDSDPRYAGTFVINPALSFANPAAHVAGILRYLVPVSRPISNDINRPGQDELAYSATPTGGVYELDKLINATRAKLLRNAPILKPVHLFRSTVDHVVPESSAHFLRRCLGTHLEQTALTRSFHVATMDYDLPLMTSTILKKIGNRVGKQA